LVVDHVRGRSATALNSLQHKLTVRANPDWCVNAGAAACSQISFDRCAFVPLACESSASAIR
jgi:hypothetical protein